MSRAKKTDDGGRRRQTCSGDRTQTRARVRAQEQARAQSYKDGRSRGGNRRGWKTRGEDSGRSWTYWVNFHVGELVSVSTIFNDSRGRGRLDPHLYQILDKGDERTEGRTGDDGKGLRCQWRRWTRRDFASSRREIKGWRRDGSWRSELEKRCPTEPGSIQVGTLGRYGCCCRERMYG